MDVLYRYSIACGNVFVSACHLVMVWRSFSAHRYGMVYRNIDRSEETTQKKNANDKAVAASQQIKIGMENRKPQVI